MKTIHRVELEAVTHLSTGEAVVLRDAGSATAYGIYVVSSEHSEGMPVPYYVTEHAAQEDAYNAAVALAGAIGVELENRIPMSMRFAGQQ